jgi:hypothetical protein
VSDWTSEYLQLIEDCEHRESRCSDWDKQFLDSIKNRLAQGIHLTSKQTEKLDEIWERVTAKG